MQEVKNYFPLEKVKEGLFKIYQKILGLRFIEVKLIINGMMKLNYMMLLIKK